MLVLLLLLASYSEAVTYTDSFPHTNGTCIVQGEFFNSVFTSLFFFLLFVQLLHCPLSLYLLVNSLGLIRNQTSLKTPSPHPFYPLLHVALILTLDVPSPGECGDYPCYHENGKAPLTVNDELRYHEFKILSLSILNNSGTVGLSLSPAEGLPKSSLLLKQNIISLSTIQLQIVF